MNELGDRPLRPQPPPTFEIQLGNLPPAVRSVAESLAMRDMESRLCEVLRSATMLSQDTGTKSFDWVGNILGWEI